MVTVVLIGLQQKLKQYLQLHYKADIFIGVNRFGIAMQYFLYYLATVFDVTERYRGEFNFYLYR